MACANYRHGLDVGDAYFGATKVFESEDAARYPFGGAVVLFSDIIEVLRLAQRDDKIGIFLEAASFRLFMCYINNTKF